MRCLILNELVNDLDLPLIFEPYLSSIQDEVFGADFTKAAPSNVLWEAYRCFIDVLELEDGKKVVEEVSEIVGLNSSLKNSLDKMQTMSL